ncbi:MAG: MFS transporter [Desulfuromonadales bacterium]
MSQNNINKAQLGWCIYDWANSAFATVVLAAVLPVYFASLVPAQGADVFWSSKPVAATALWGYIVSFSMACVAMTAPGLGNLADRRGWRRRLLIIFCLLGSLATCGLFFAGPGRYLLAAALFILGNIGFASGNIFYNAYLPDLAQGHEADRLSARGFALGYIGGGLMLLIVFLLIEQHMMFGIPDKAFLLYNDGIQTIIAVSAIFGREELGLSTGTILGCFLMIQFVAMPGALLFARLAGRFNTKRAVLASLVLFTAITVYASIMRSAIEFWMLGFAVAIVLGGSQALSRSLFSSLVPKKRSAEFFGFYAISSKFASIFGPLTFALLIDMTGSNRLAILALALFFVVGVVVLLGVDVEKGRLQAES